MTRMLVINSIIYFKIYSSVLTPSRNKKLTSKHCFLLFIATNNVAYSVNKDPNQLYTKVKTKNNGILKHITTIYISYKKCKKNKNRNGMIWITYLKKRLLITNINIIIIHILEKPRI
jgi:hypothetical protein